MGIISKKAGKSVFSSIDGIEIEVGAGQIGATELASDSVTTVKILNGNVTKAKTSMVSGTISLDGTAEGTFSHTLGATPTFISVVGYGAGSCQPFVVAIGSDKGTLTCTGTGVAYWAVM